jgi:hypothetical protein
MQHWPLLLIAQSMVGSGVLDWIFEGAVSLYRTILDWLPSLLTTRVFIGVAAMVVVLGIVFRRRSDRRF